MKSISSAHLPPIILLLLTPFPCEAIITIYSQQNNQTSTPFTASPSTPANKQYRDNFVFGDDQPGIPLPIAMPLRGRGESTIRIGGGRRGNKNGTGIVVSTRTRSPHRRPQSINTQGDQCGSMSNESIRVGLFLPYSMFHKRDYLRIVNKTMESLKQNRQFISLFENHFKDDPNQHFLLRMITFNLSPRDIQRALCDELLKCNVAAIIYMTNTELYEAASIESSEYLFKLADNLALPVIAWNADNSGYQRRASYGKLSTSGNRQMEMVLQLAPSIHHQVAAMLSILTRYNWYQFAIVTSQIAGHDDFVRAVHDRIRESHIKFTILQKVIVLNETDLFPLTHSETRIFLLYCTKVEAKWIMQAATKYGLTGSNYVWIVTQSVIGDWLNVFHSRYYSSYSYDLPIGVLGVNFNTSITALKSEIPTAIRVFVNGVQQFWNDSGNNKINLTPRLSSCTGAGDKAHWREGEHFYRALSSAMIDSSDEKKPPLTFNSDGTLENVELQILNFRPLATNESRLDWKPIGVWQSWRTSDEQLDIKDIVWPGKSHKPPEGVPQKCLSESGVICKTSNNSATDHHSSPSSNNSSSHLGGSFALNISVDNSSLQYYKLSSGFSFGRLFEYVFQTLNILLL